MENNHPINELMATTLQKIREMVDANTIVGEAISAGDGITLIPISKLSFGFASGGSEFVTKNHRPESGNAFGGGSGASVSISPIAFLIVKDGSVKLLPVSIPAGTTVDRVVEMVPDLVDKVTEFIEKKQEKDKETL